MSATEHPSPDGGPPGNQHPTRQKEFEVKACWFLHTADHKASI